MQGMIHSAVLHSKRQKYSLAYDGGTKAFTIGKTLTGATSHATATIVSTGAVASGTLTLHTITGTFQNNEVISDNGTVPGAAVVNGVISETLDEYGQTTFADVDSTVSCRFFSSQDMIRVGGQALYGETTLKVLLDGSAGPIKGDTITGASTGHTGTFLIDSATPASARDGTTPFNYTCKLARAA